MKVLSRIRLERTDFERTDFDLGIFFDFFVPMDSVPIEEGAKGTSRLSGKFEVVDLVPTLVGAEDALGRQNA